MAASWRRHWTRGLYGCGVLQRGKTLMGHTDWVREVVFPPGGTGIRRRDATSVEFYDGPNQVNAGGPYGRRPQCSLFLLWQ